MKYQPISDEVMDGAGWTVPGLLHLRSKRTPQAIAQWQLAPDGQWIQGTWGEYCSAVASIACGFRRLGLVEGDRVGIMAASSKEWDYAQLGILAAGGVAIGLDPHGLDEHTQEIAHRCEFAGVVLTNPALLDKLGDEARRRLRYVVSIEPTTQTGIATLDSMIAELADEARWNRAQPDSTATIIFTSGTTGTPKGIEYSHRQMCLAAAAILSAFPELRDGSRLACWLPLSNLFQRMINLCAISRGAQTFYVADPREIMRYAPQIAPHVFIGVPRFYEKLYSGIQEALGKKPAWQQQLAQWARRIGDRHATALRAGLPPGLGLTLKFAVADRLVLKQLRGILGPNLQFMISGSAPMPVWLLERFHAIGLPVLEAYGLSENIIPVSLNRPGHFRFGTVGNPLPGCEVRLAEDSELLVRGPGVFHGYFGDDNAEARIDSDGFLTSGDFAHIDDDGFITLIGRKSEIFKTSTGRRVAPSSIESQLRQLAFVEYAAVCGAGRALPTALLAVNKAPWQEEARGYCQQLRAEAARVLAPLPAYLRPAGLALTTQMFTLAGGELTANLKMRRRNIEQNFSSVLDELNMHIDKAAGAPFETLSKDGLVLFLSL
ncbi:long-chain fatty acid--CoA ligase [Propionivibrio sp.]|uniref:AMP-dependent synthetase/ligase n=1 Tax=Propionivibrio sp. TaxID=2212460 RepID=UPI0025FC9068|nr:AMP-binding protein [Propionivibrio sp.]